MPFVYSRWIALDLDRDRQKPYGFYLQQKTNEIGIKFVHTKPSLDPQLSPIMPHLTALGSSISVVDYNNDGWQDLYVTNSRNGKQNGLFQNKKNDSVFGSISRTFFWTSETKLSSSIFATFYVRSLG